MDQWYGLAIALIVPAVMCLALGVGIKGISFRESMTKEGLTRTKNPFAYQPGRVGMMVQAEQNTRRLSHAVKSLTGLRLFNESPLPLEDIPEDPREGKTLDQIPSPKKRVQKKEEEPTRRQKLSMIEDKLPGQLDVEEGAAPPEVRPSQSAVTGGTEDSPQPPAAGPSQRGRALHLLNHIGQDFLA
jgi:hypothetical protein